MPATPAGNKGADITAHGGDLPDQCGRYGPRRRAGWQENGLQVWRHLPVHARKLHFVVEI